MTVSNNSKHKANTVSNDPKPVKPMKGGSIFRLLCTSIVVPGIDTPYDASDPLCDSKVRLGMPLDEVLIDSFVSRGWDGAPMSCVVRDGKFVVVDGRRRTLHIREAMKRINAELYCEFTVREDTDPRILAVARK